MNENGRSKKSKDVKEIIRQRKKTNKKTSLQSGRKQSIKMWKLKS